MKKANRIMEEAALKNVMDGFISSYTERDKAVDFSDWLAKRFQHEMPNMPVDASKRLSKEIIEGVKAYDQTLSDLNAAVESGQSKEEWLADRTAEAYADMPLDDTGGKLQKIDADLNTSNTLLMQEIEGIDEDEDEAMAADDEIVEWNKYSVKNKVFDIGRQAVMSGLGVAAVAVKENMDSGADAGSAIGQALQDGFETAKSEVKSVVAGAIKTAVEKKLISIMPANTPTFVICDMAGVAVESAGALLNAAIGKTTMVEALDKVGRASVAAACRFCTYSLKGVLAGIPYVGPLVVKCASGFLDHMSSAKFTENVYTVVRDAACATWGGIKQTGRSIWNKLKSSVTEFLRN